MTNISVSQVPLLPQPQKFSIVLLGITYNMRTRWSNLSNAWMLDISDADLVPIVGSIPLVVGADLLEEYEYLNIEGGLWVQNTTGPADDVPGFNDFGSIARLLFIPYSLYTN